MSKIHTIAPHACRCQSPLYYSSFELELRRHFPSRLCRFGEAGNIQHSAADHHGDDQQWLSGGGQRYHSQRVGCQGEPPHRLVRLSRRLGQAMEARWEGTGHPPAKEVKDQHQDWQTGLLRRQHQDQLPRQVRLLALGLAALLHRL